MAQTKDNSLTYKLTCSICEKKFKKLKKDKHKNTIDDMNPICENCDVTKGYRGINGAVNDVIKSKGAKKIENMKKLMDKFTNFDEDGD